MRQAFRQPLKDPVPLRSAPRLVKTSHKLRHDVVEQVIDAYRIWGTLRTAEERFLGAAMSLPAGRREGGNFLPTRPNTPLRPKCAYPRSGRFRFLPLPLICPPRLCPAYFPQASRLSPLGLYD